MAISQDNSLAEIMRGEYESRLADIDAVFIVTNFAFRTNGTFRRGALIEATKCAQLWIGQECIIEVTKDVFRLGLVTFRDGDIACFQLRSKADSPYSMDRPFLKRRVKNVFRTRDIHFVDYYELQPILPRDLRLRLDEKLSKSIIKMRPSKQSQYLDLLAARHLPKTNPAEMLQKLAA